MTDQEIMEQIDKSLCLKKGEAKRESRLEEDLGADELDVIELSMHLDDHFGIGINNDQEADWETVEDVIKTEREVENE